MPDFTVDELAQEIRRVDGSNSLGAGALAEALMPFLQGRVEKPVGWLDAKIKAVHEALGGNGWAYSNYGNDELYTHRDRLEAVVRVCCAATPDEKPKPSPITYEPCCGCGATTPMERCIGCFHKFEMTA